MSLRAGDASPRPSIMQVVESRRHVFRGHSYTDFAFHYILADRVGPETVGQLGEAVQEGIASFKFFTNGRIGFDGEGGRG